MTPQHEELRVQSDALRDLAQQMTDAKPSTREEWEAIIEIRDASRCLFSAAGWLARLDERLET